MTIATIFLARLIGAYCIIFAAAMLIRRPQSIKVVRSILNDTGIMMLSGIIALACGIAMILTHNVWTGGPLPIVVTLIGWLMALKGAVALLLSPSQVQNAYNRMRYEHYFIGYMSFTLVLGLYLVWATTVA